MYTLDFRTATCIGAHICLLSVIYVGQVRAERATEKALYLHKASLHCICFNYTTQQNQTELYHEVWYIRIVLLMRTHFCQFWTNNFVFQQVNENQRLTYYIPFCKKNTAGQTRLSNWGEPWEHNCVRLISGSVSPDLYLHLTCTFVPPLTTLPPQMIQKKKKKRKTVRTINLHPRSNWAG